MVCAYDMLCCGNAFVECPLKPFPRGFDAAQTIQDMIPIFSASIVNSGLDLRTPINRVLSSNWYVLGKEVAAFEGEFADYVGSRHCVTLANGTDALELGLRALGVERGDKVACAPNAGFYGSTAIHAIGALPLYVDIDSRTLNLSVAAFEQAIANERPKAVIATHLYGQLADIGPLVRIAHAAGIAVIEDCAQAHGAMRGGRRAGSFGDIGCFSFYPTKNLGALGDGGAVVTGDAALDAKVRALRQYGWSSKYEVAVPHGRNSRLDEIQAAVLRDKLPTLDACNAQRRAIAAKYNAAFASLPIQLPPSNREDFVAHLYVVRMDGRDSFRQHLRSCSVATDVHYPLADHLQSAYLSTPGVSGLPNAETACKSVVTLPCFPGLSDSEVDIVIDAVHSFFSH